MSRLVIMCIETNKKARTDEVYIKSVINRFFVNDRKNICKYVYLETKTKYKDRGRYLWKFNLRKISCYNIETKICG